MSNFRSIDWSDIRDQEDFLSLLAGYRQDPMGEGPELTREEGAQIIEDLRCLEQVKGFFCCISHKPVGYLLAFEGYTTFGAGKAYNVHDFYVDPEFRHGGHGKYLMEHFLHWVEEQGGRRVTLEVREDNQPARRLYDELGFAPTQPEMDFFVRNMV